MEYKFSDFVNEFNLKGKNSPYSYDNFIRNEFEAYVYFEYKKLNTNYFGGVVRFINLIRQKIDLLKITNSPLDNLYVLLFYIENSFSKIEMIFYLNCIRKWIDWNNRNKYRYYYLPGWYNNKQKVISIYPIEKIRKSFSDLNGLVNAYIEKLQNGIGENELDEPLHDMSSSGYAKVSLKKSEKLANETATSFISNEEKIKEVIKVLEFLKGKYISQADHELFLKYVSQIIVDGILGDDIEPIKIKRVTKTDVTYTFYLLNNIIVGSQTKKRDRNIYIFKLMAFSIVGYGFEKDKIIFSVSKKRINAELKLKSNTYKNFTNKPTKKYSQINPYYSAFIDKKS